MNGEVRPRGHKTIVTSLAAVPCGEKRVLLASADMAGFVQLSDSRTGDPVAGPVRVDDEAVWDLAAVRLRSGDWALAVCGEHALTLWDPLHFGEGESPLRTIDANFATAMTVLPATATTAALMVVADRDVVRAIDPDDGRTVARFAQPETATGQLPNKVHRLTGGMVDAETAGFVAASFLDDLEVWALRADGLHRHPFELTRTSSDGTALLTDAAGDPVLAVASRRTISVWNLRTRRQVTRTDFDTLFTAVAPVPSPGRTLLAGAFTDVRDNRVQLWDPQTCQPVGTPVNQHGPDFDEEMKLNIEIRTVICVPDSDGTLRLASGASDGGLRVSAPLDVSAVTSTPDTGADGEIRITDNRRVRAATVEEAVEAIVEVINATPVTDLARLQAAYHHLRSSWSGPGLVTGSPAEIVDVLSANLELDATRAAGVNFLIDLMPHEMCSQVYSRVDGMAVGYRIWRTADTVAVFGSRYDMIRRRGERRPGPWRSLLRRRLSR